MHVSNSVLLTLFALIITSKAQSGNLLTSAYPQANSSLLLHVFDSAGNSSERRVTSVAGDATLDTGTIAGNNLREVTAVQLRSFFL